MIDQNIREVGGEIWAELWYRQRDPQHLLAAMDWRFTSEIVDVVMGVLARHFGEKIVNDEEFPVTPLPEKVFEE